MKNTKNLELGDPGMNEQNFLDNKIKLQCCRYWTLSLWDCYDMTFPFWRIYWNRNIGGKLIFRDSEIDMIPDFIYIIPPFTSFSSQFNDNHRFKNGINVLGRNVIDSDNELDLAKKNLLHLFVHFNLGIPYDNVFPAIFKVPLDSYLKERIDYLTGRLKIETTNFKVTFNLKLLSFITEVISNIGNKLWKTINIDGRVLDILRYIEDNIDKNLSNQQIASEVNMAPNSFARLFKEEMNISLHDFVQKRKMARACEFLENSNLSIEEIAYQLGFSDRYHFSRVFKQITQFSPASYKSRKYN